jgi:predicted Ser/Thr protein kinase
MVVILAHSNESEWSKFSNDKKNEAFLDRVYMVRVPYSLRVDEEIKIYEKLVRESSSATHRVPQNTGYFIAIYRNEPPKRAG